MLIMFEQYKVGQEILSLSKQAGIETMNSIQDLLASLKISSLLNDNFRKRYKKYREIENVVTAFTEL